MAAVNNRALKFFKPPEKVNIWQWAEKYRFLAKGVSARSLEGPVLYSTNDAPHQRKPQESFTDPETQITVVCGASQVMGKTEMFNNAVGYHMAHTPRSAVIMYPTLDAAQKYSKKKFTPMVEATPVLAKLIKSKRERDSGNTILTKEFRGGAVFFVGANSSTSLRQASGELLIGDEIDSNEPSAGNEGDPIELLWKRGESFPRVVKILASTPTTGARDQNGVCLSPIWAVFEMSDQQYWYCPCPKCGTFQKLTWKQIVWPKEGDKHLTDRAELICSSCSAALNDAQRIQMYYEGRWEATAEFNGIRGFHLNGIYCPWPAHKGYKNRLHQMAEESVRANRKGALAVRVWVNTFLSEPSDEGSEKIDHAPLLERCEPYTPQTIPDAVIIITASADIQKDRIEVETVGLGLDDESWGIEKRVFYGDTEQDEVWEELGNYLATPCQREDGVALPIICTAIDMRHKSKKVREFIRQSGLPRVYPVYGVAAHTPILVTSRFVKSYRLRTYAVNGKVAKDIIFARLKITEAGSRYMHFPKGYGYDEAHFKQLTAEVLKVKYTHGFPQQFYEKIRERNEALDLRVYWLAGLDILKPSLTAIAKKQKVPSLPTGEEGRGEQNKDYYLKPRSSPASHPTPAKPKPTKPVRPPRPGAGFISKWKQ